VSASASSETTDVTVTTYTIEIKFRFSTTRYFGAFVNYKRYISAYTLYF